MSIALTINNKLFDIFPPEVPHITEEAVQVFNEITKEKGQCPFYTWDDGRKEVSPRRVVKFYADFTLPYKDHSFSANLVVIVMLITAIVTGYFSLGWLSGASLAVMVLAFEKARSLRNFAHLREVYVPKMSEMKPKIEKYLEECTRYFTTNDIQGPILQKVSKIPIPDHLYSSMCTIGAATSFFKRIPH